MSCWLFFCCDESDSQCRSGGEVAPPQHASFCSAQPSALRAPCWLVPRAHQNERSPKQVSQPVPRAVALRGRADLFMRHPSRIKSGTTTASLVDHNPLLATDGFQGKEVYDDHLLI